MIRSRLHSAVPQAIRDTCCGRPAGAAPDTGRLHPGHRASGVSMTHNPVGRIPARMAAYPSEGPRAEALEALRGRCAAALRHEIRLSPGGGTAPALRWGRRQERGSRLPSRSGRLAAGTRGAGSCGRWSARPGGSGTPPWVRIGVCLPRWAGGPRSLPLPGTRSLRGPVHSDTVGGSRDPACVRRRDAREEAGLASREPEGGFGRSEDRPGAGCV